MERVAARHPASGASVMAPRRQAHNTGSLFHPGDCARPVGHDSAQAYRSLSLLDCCVLVGDCTGFWACGGRKRHTSVIPTPQTRVPRVVGVRARAGSGWLTGCPRGLWGDTTQPVLKSVTCAYLPQMVGHTPRRAQTNRLGLATDCASDAPHHEEATRPS
jgi:hypothetical protein